MATSGTTPANPNESTPQPVQPQIPPPRPVVKPESVTAVLALACEVADHAALADRLAKTSEEKQNADRIQ